MVFGLPEGPLKWDYVQVDGLVLTHKQIEIKNGITYMRMKKRPVMRVYRKS